MVMASCMSHEEKSATEIKKLMEKEQNEPLTIRAEPSDPMALISTHQLLVANRQSSLKYILRTWRDFLEMTAFMLV